MHRIQKSTVLLFPAVAAFVAVQPVAAETWRVRPSLSIQETYTDNVNLDSAAAQGDFVTQVTSGLNVSANGARLQTQISYNLNTFYYPASDQDNFELRHNLRGTFSTEIIPDFFFISANADIHQQFLDRRGSFTSVDVSRTENRATVQSYGINPYIVQPLGSWAVMSLRYNFSYVTSSDGDRLDQAGSNFRNSTRHAGTLGLASGRKFSRIGWSIAGNYSKEGRTSSQDFDRYGVNADLSYRLTRKLSLLGSAGYQKRDANNSFANFNGFVWDLGFRLVPGPRTSISFRYGNQYSGDTFSLDALYKITPKVNFKLTYSDRLQTSQFLTVGDIFLDPFSGNLLITPVLDDSFTRQRAWTASVTGTRGRTVLSLQASYHRFEGELATRDEKRYAFTGTVSRKLSSRLSLNVSGTIDRSRFSQALSNDVFWSARSGVQYKLSKSLSSSLSYIHSKRDVRGGSDIIQRSSNYVSFSIRVAL